MSCPAGVKIHLEDPAALLWCSRWIDPCRMLGGENEIDGRSSISGACCVIYTRIVSSFYGVDSLLKENVDSCAYHLFLLNCIIIHGNISVLYV